MSITILASFALAHSIVAFGSDELTIGDAAPVPQIEHWVRGTQPEFFAPGKTYVVEFWATWCGPCRTSMPHLSDLSEKYADKGVVVVGISDEKLEVVSKFLGKDEWKEKARYILATDPDRSTHDAYMKAAAQGGIPTSFIVKDGKVQWIGHPMSMDGPLAEIVGGTWDMAAYKAKFEPQQAAARANMKRSAAIRKARESGDWDGLVTMLDEGIATAKGPAKTQIQLQKFNILLMDANKPDAAYALGREL
ncbi:MAG: TlpA family protein disulfide reductase, partial [Phycisphaerae bacterium]|nr:TlpA family protein disulfide reductase [Phycisphaerae bacterium]